MIGDTDSTTTSLVANMQVLHLIDSAGLYGAEKLLLGLIRHQRKIGVNAALGSLGGKADRERPIEVMARRMEIPIHKFPMRRGLNMMGGMQVVNFARANMFDLLHSHTYKGNIIVGLLPRRFRAMPLVMTLHGWRPPMSLLMRLIQSIEVHGILRADHVTLVDDSLAADPRLSRLPAQRISIVRNGITAPTTPANKDLIHQIQDFLGDRFSIAAVGRLSREKGLDLLLEALAELRSGGLDCAVCVFGDGEERNRLEQMIVNYKLQSFVKLFGYVDSATSYLAPFDCVVMPSRTEGMPLVALEAMHMGTPLVAADVGGLPALLSHGRYGRLFPADDGAALVAAIRDVYQDEESSRHMAEAARDAVRSEHTVEPMVQKYVQIYKQLLGLTDNLI